MASAKSQIINILGLTASVIVRKHACQQVNKWACVPIKLYLYKQVVGQIWPSGHSLLISELHELYCPFQW